LFYKQSTCVFAIWNVADKSLTCRPSKLCVNVVGGKVGNRITMTQTQNEMYTKQ